MKVRLQGPSKPNIVSPFSRARTVSAGSGRWVTIAAHAAAKTPPGRRMLADVKPVFVENLAARQAGEGRQLVEVRGHQPASR